MPARKSQGWLDKNWPFKYKSVGLNGDTGFIKIFAMITMLIDHVGAALFPEHAILRIIGRIAFPVYAYCIAAGCVYTKDMGRYLQRIVLLALISQPIYVLALNHTNTIMFSVPFAENPLLSVYRFYVYSWRDPSILLTLAIGIAAIWSFRERKLWITLLLFILTFTFERYIDYGVRGVFLMLLLYAFINTWYISLPLVAAFMIYWGLDGSRYSLFGVSFGIQMFAVMALPLIYIPMRTNFKPNKWLFYCFYPAHLLLIYVIEKWDSIMAFLR